MYFPDMGGVRTHPTHLVCLRHCLTSVMITTLIIHHSVILSFQPQNF